MAVNLEQEVKNLKVKINRLNRQINHMKNCENCSERGCNELENDDKADQCLNHEHKYWELCD